jgi:hypothetical protein
VALGVIHDLQRRGSVSHGRPEPPSLDHHLAHVSAAQMAGRTPKIEHLESPEWSTWIFLKHLAYHLLAPFSIPLVVIFEGKHFAGNSAFLLKTAAALPFYVLTHFLNLTILLINAVWLWRHFSPSTSHSQLYLVEILSMDLLHVGRLVMIAVKYAFVLVDPYWQKQLMETELDPDVSASLLLAVWVAPKEMFVKRELGVAQERAGIGLAGRCFEVPMDSSDSIFRAFVRRSEPGRVALSKVDALEVLSRVMVRSLAIPVPWGRLSLLLSAGVAAIPHIYRGVYKFKLDPLDAACAFFTTMWTMALTYVLLTYMRAAHADARRRTLSLAALNILISDNTRDHTAVAIQRKHGLNVFERYVRELEIDLIDVSFPSNVHTWIAMFTVVQRFALDYKLRMETFITVCLLTVVIILLIVVSALLSHTSQPILIIYSLVTVVGIIAFALRVVLASITCNKLFTTIRMTLTTVAARIGLARSELPPDSAMAQRLAHAEAALNSAVAVVAIEDEVGPMRVGGSKASTAALRAIIGVSFSLSAFCFQLIVQK